MENPASTDGSFVESELLVASFACNGQAAHRDAVWKHYFGAAADPWERLAPDDRTVARRFVQEAAQGTLFTHQLLTLTVPHRDEPVPVLLNFQPVYGPDVPPRVLAVAVTGEVLAEPTSWMVAQTKRHRLETLGRMTMGIAHDFNNLLSGILGHAELLLEGAGQPLGAAAIAEHVGTIKRAALDGAEVVSKIQRFIRQEKKAHSELLDVREVLNESLALTRPYWYNEPRRQGIQIELYTQLTAVPRIMGSGSELREVFVNMVLNAVQAMPEGGRLRVACRPLTDRRQVEVIIEDTGIGMTDEVAARIFEPLYTTKGEQGTGMGLAVSYGIIQSHEGAVAVQSRPQQGTLFRITLPAAADQRGAREAPSETAPAARGTILLVDDEPMVSGVLAKLLERRGHTVETATGGADALARAAEKRFDVVVTDLGMPEMNGRALAARLHALYPALPILLLSGDTEPGGADDTIAEVLAKPFRIGEVEAALQRALR